MDDIAKIAEGLNNDARHFIPQLRDRFSIHPGRQSTAVRTFLLDAERRGILINPSFDNYGLTPLGIAVRDYLRSKNDG